MKNIKLFSRFTANLKSSFSTLSVRTKNGHLRWAKPEEGFLSIQIAKRVKWFNDLFRRNAGRGLINELLKVCRAIHPRISSNTVLQVVMFTRKAHKIYKHNGYAGLTIYLKACQVLLQQSIGGYKVKDLSELKCRPKRSRYGSPLLIHRSSRNLIHKGYSKRLITLWMTLFGVYRVLQFKGQLKLSTITKPFQLKDTVQKAWDDFVVNTFQKTLLRDVSHTFVDPPTMELRPINTSSPTSRILKDLDSNYEPSIVASHMASVWLAAKLWMQTPWFENLKRFSSRLRAPYFVERIRMISTANPTFQNDTKNWVNATTYDSSPDLDNRIYSTDQGKTWSFQYKDPLPLTMSPQKQEVLHARARGTLAKLALKYEAAGKIRVFAMVDPFTQWVMDPLHKLLFRILDNLNTDGTFNQTKPVERLIQSLGSPTGFVPGRTFYSLDLSAATDRLPISIQKTLVSLVWDLGWNRDVKAFAPLSSDSIEFGTDWVTLLVARSYNLNLSKEDLKNIKGKKQLSYKLRYAVGQPMGALSSWAMLALTHHAIVAFCAKRAGYDNFTDYAVLGDDIIIANAKVANNYLKFLNKELGVEVGLAKSIISRRHLVLEFAKKFFVNSEQMNMVPIKDVIASWTSTSLVKEFATKWQMSISQTFSFLGYGYKAKSRVFSSKIWDLPLRSRVLVLWLSTPKSPQGKSNWVEWLSMISLNESRTLERDDLIIMFTKIYSHLKKSWDRYDVTFNDWFGSIERMNKKADSLTPVTRNRMVQSSGGDNIYFEQITVPFETIIGTPLSEPADYSFDASDSRVHTGMVSHTFNRLDTDELKDWYNLLKGKQEMEFQFRPHRLSEKILCQRIEWFCNFLFYGNSYEDRLRSDVWPLTRTQEKGLDDFNALYSFWVDVTKHLFEHDNLSRQKTLKRVKVTEDSNNKKEEVVRSTITSLIPLHSPRLLKELPYSYSLSDYIVVLQPLKGMKQISWWKRAEIEFYSRLASFYLSCVLKVSKILESILAMIIAIIIISIVGARNRVSGYIPPPFIEERGPEDTNYWYWIGIGLVVLSVVAVIYYYYGKDSPSGMSPPSQPQISGPDISPLDPVYPDLTRALTDIPLNDGIDLVGLVTENRLLGRRILETDVQIHHLMSFYDSNIRVIDSFIDAISTYKSQISLLEKKISSMEIDLSDGTLALNSLKRSLSSLDSHLLATTHKLDSLNYAISKAGHSVVQSGSGYDLSCPADMTLSKIDLIVRDYYQGVTNSEGILTGSSETVGMVGSVIREYFH